MSVSTPISSPSSLFDKYGGLRVLRNVIMDFYDRVLDDDTIGPYFDDVDMPKLIDHQMKFFTMLLGGPASFSEDRLKRAHLHMRLSDSEFDVVGQILSDTLTGAGFLKQDHDRVLDAIESRRHLIVAP